MGRGLERGKPRARTSRLKGMAQHGSGPGP